MAVAGLAQQRADLLIALLTCWEGGLAWLFPLPGPPLSYTQVLSPGKVTDQPHMLLCRLESWATTVPLACLPVLRLG